MTEENSALPREGVEEGVGCVVGACGRLATMRDHTGAAFCAPHLLWVELGRDEDEAALALELLRGWRSEAEAHGDTEDLIRDLDALIGRWDLAHWEAEQRLRLADQADAESRARPGTGS